MAKLVCKFRGYNLVGFIQNNAIFKQFQDPMTQRVYKAFVYVKSFDEGVSKVFDEKV